MKKPFVIGIAGGSASGKSTLSDNLESIFKDSVKLLALHMDDYFRPVEERPVSPAPITGKFYLDDNHPDSMNLDKLYEDLISAIESEAYGLIIVEGLLTLWHKEICGRLDLKLFVDCNADERIVRRIYRNTRWGLSFDDITNVYLDLVRYRHDEYVEPTKWRADMIINGSYSSQTALEMIAGYVKSHI